MDTLKTEDAPMWLHCCRICVRLCDAQYCIYGGIDNDRTLSLHSMLEKLFPAVFNPEQVERDRFMNWPSSICPDCRCNVINAYVLYEKCENSFLLLNQLQFIAIVDDVATIPNESCVPEQPSEEELQLVVPNTCSLGVESPVEPIVVDNVPKQPETVQSSKRASVKKFQIIVPIIKRTKRKKGKTSKCKSTSGQLKARIKRKKRQQCDSDCNGDVARTLFTNKQQRPQRDDGNSNRARLFFTNNEKRPKCDSDGNGDAARTLFANKEQRPQCDDGNSTTARLFFANNEKRVQCDDSKLPGESTKENYNLQLAATETSQSSIITVKNQEGDHSTGRSIDVTKVWPADADELETTIDLYQCVLCDAPTYSSPKEFTEHLKENHPEHIRACEQCPKVFVTQTAFEQHLYCHATGRSFFCTFCDKGFQTVQLLKNHIRTHTHRSNYLCSHCGKEFKNSSNLRQHIIVHSGSKPWACNLCPSRFGTKGGLTIHQNTHTKVKAFSCDTCGSQFNKHYSLIKHKLVHTGERPFGCEVCGMRFATSYMVKRHMRTHTGEKPFKCTYCDRSYAQSNDMVKHMKKHVGSNPYQCDRCDATFRLLTDLRNHYKEHYQTGELSATDQDKSIRFTSRDILQLRFQKEKEEPPEGHE